MRTRSSAVLACIFLAACPDATTAPASSSASTNPTSVSITTSDCQAVQPPVGDGWISCKGVITVKNLSKKASSGYVSGFMNWGCGVGGYCAAYFHGETAVGTRTPPDTFSITTVSTNLPRANCKSSMPTTIDLYDGRQNADGAKLLVSVPVTLSCT